MLFSFVAGLRRIDYLSFVCDERCRVCDKTVDDDLRFALDKSLRDTGGPDGEARFYTLCTTCRASMERCSSILYWLPLPKIEETVGSAETMPLLPVYTAGSYNGVTRKLIRRLKYDDDRLIARDLSTLLTRGVTLLRASVAADFGGCRAADTVLIPVPLHKKRQKERSYNQAELLARELACRTELQCNFRALTRMKNTSPQFGLSREKRISNVKDAFTCSAREIGKLENKLLVLVDDVYTTGSTLISCAQALASAGASRIAAIAVARSQLKGTLQ